MPSQDQIGHTKTGSEPLTDHGAFHFGATDRLGGYLIEAKGAVDEVNSPATLIGIIVGAAMIGAVIFAYICYALIVG